ncbi:MAG: SpoIIE family protein phosphatase [Firmicutes bacterium]|nr:SpoIIE family protein phosphatase [Bacillota bacterium]
MKYLSAWVEQVRKEGESVCGDVTVYRRENGQTYFILCDGVGSGEYANGAALKSCERLMPQLLTEDPETACAREAAYMHQARSAEFPFAAFTAVVLDADGHYIAYAFEAPGPLHISKKRVSVLPRETVAAGEESMQRFSGQLQPGEYLLLLSDGVTQAGLGMGFGYGIGEQGTARYLNLRLSAYPDADLRELMRDLCSYTAKISGGRLDDTSLALLECREEE